MAKPPTKSNKPDAPAETPANEVMPPLEDETKPEAPSPVPASVKKEAPKPKKPMPTKTSSLLPSQQKLEHLKSAVAAAGNIDQLIVILNHVEDAGGRKEVLESIEAYRVLKTVLEE